MNNQVQPTKTFIQALPNWDLIPPGGMIIKKVVRK